MVFHVLDRRENAVGWLLAVILTPICILATVFRFMATKRGQRHIGWEDYWALLGLIFYIPYAVYLLMIISYADGRTPTAYIKQDPRNWITMAKYGLMMNGLYALQQTFVKFSLLALYHRIFWVNKGFVRMVWSVGIVQGMWGIAVLLCHIFSCVPVKKAWYPKTPGTCLNINLMFSITEPINSAIDFVMAGMAIFILRKLSVHRNTARIWGVSILFVLGAFSGIIGLIKTAEAQHSAKRNFRSVIWNLVQMATSIICCCAPIYRSLIPDISFGSLGSWASHTFRSATRSKSSVHHSTDSGGRSRGFTPKSKTSTKSSSKDGNPGLSKYGAPWEKIDEGSSSQRELAWAEVSAMDEDLPSRPDGIPLRTVKIKQSVERVERV